VTTRNIRVLVADDDADVREAMAGIVETEPGMTLVATADTAVRAVALCAVEKPDVAIIDVGMPGGGAQAARGIRRGSPDTHILVLSGHGDRETVLAMIEAGADSYLVKSSDIDTIVGAITRAASGQGSLSTEVTGGVLEELTGQLSVRRRAEEKKQRSTTRMRRVLKDESQRLIVFQPIVSLDTGEPTAVEALSRFYGTPRRSPDKWFAEAASVSPACLRDLELATSATALSALDVLREDLAISINLSPHTLSSAAFRRLLHEHDATRIIIEITEHAPVADYHALRGVLTAVRQAGARIAIDDAGAGYASLRHILRLEPEIIKLDRELTEGIATDRQQQALAAGLIAFAERAGSRIVAEGIENAEQVNALGVLGVRWGQGYHFAQPGPLPAALRRP
jgi:EAL domain-containing protein (putative c-di-GMP-specific phosphodiesterase class I)/AmiR/NasT family two-component response regulator